MRRLIAIWISILLIVSSVIMVIDVGEEAEGKVVGGNGVTYVPHAPISINGDGDFAMQATAEVWPGNGTQGNPYIIEGYEINASAAQGIYIEGTTVHFIIRDSFIRDGAPSYYGILFLNVWNGTVNNCTLTNNWDGICLDNSDYNTITGNNASSNNENGINLQGGSSNNTVSNNTASLNYNGIFLESSSNNTISNNTASSNNEDGIRLDSSGNNTLTGNTISNNDEFGIYLRHSGNNTLTGNTMVGCGIDIEGWILEHWNTHTIDTSNTVNGKPVYYWKNQTGGTIPLGAGQVILANCTNVVVENQNVNDGSVGIGLGFSSGCNITGNTASSNNCAGIYIGFFSNNNNITDNTASSNNGDGISVYASSNNTFTNNTASNNHKGIFFCQSSNNTLTGNTMVENGIVIWGGMLGYLAPLQTWNTHIIDTSNTVNGKPVYYWKDQTGGTIPLGAGQIILANCTNVVVENQDFSNCTVGIQLGYSNYNTIQGNAVSSNTFDGIDLCFSSNNTITGNTVSDNGYNGICLGLGSSNNSITGNNALNNRYGIVLVDSSNNTITGNNASNSGDAIHSGDGIALSSSNNNTITGNNASSNNQYGISIESSSNNSIYHNNFINNTDHAYDDSLGNNTWDDGYPSGGNYWSDYAGVDNNSTTAQNVPPPDGIGDTPYVFTSGQDNYPLMEPPGEYVFNLPIRIDSNADFNAAHAVTGGDGTAGDPWIIEGLDINGTGFGYCIYVGNTTDYFEVRNSYLHDASAIATIYHREPYYPGSGIIFYNVQNGSIINNTVNSNDYASIHLDSSSNNMLMNNIGSNNYGCIYLYWSSSNTFVSNVMEGIIVGGDQLSHWNTHSIDTSNTANGKPVYYWKDQTGGTVPVGAGQVILANCTGVAVENQNVDIFLGFSSSCTITQNSGNIVLQCSSNNNIINNTRTNSVWGIMLVSSSSNNITNNDVSNNYIGIYVALSNNNTISDNDASNSSIGINLESSSNNTIHNNTASSNSQYGIYLNSSNDNTITNCTISNNQNGINITGSSDCNNIYHNNFIDNTNQTYDDGLNFWNATYPSGGNYWSDYSGADDFGGPGQDLPGSDGIGDTIYTISGGSNVDNYPLMTPDLQGATLDVPSAPQNLQTSSGDGFVNLSWLEPLDEGGSAITNYSIYRGTTSGGETLLTTIGNILYYNDTSVTNNQTYYYTVSAVNGVGEGPQSSEVNATPTPALDYVKVTPVSWTMTVNQSKQFTALGYKGEVSTQISPTWSVNGGGTITGDGLFNASQEGTWTITANFSGFVGNAVVYVIEPTVNDTENEGVIIEIGVDMDLPEGWIGMRIYWANYTIDVKTNSSVLGVNFDKDTMAITLSVDGPSGTIGACEVVVPKSLMPSLSKLEVQLDGGLLEFTLTQNETHFIVHIEYTHSTHKLTTYLEGAPIAEPIVEGEENVLFPYWWVIVVIIVSLILVAFLLIRRKGPISEVEEEEEKAEKEAEEEKPSLEEEPPKSEETTSEPPPLSPEE